MSCPACGFENPAGMKFCGGCAQPLALACPRCGFESPPGFRFCGECAAPLHGMETEEPRAAERAPRDYTPRHLADKILQSKTALEGERKQVTVLFADVKGSMELSEGIDPEEWHAILDRFFQILADGVHRFEGTVNQYTGDGIMALFGAPIAHEDHAQRGCYAVLHLRGELERYADSLRVSKGLNFSVRMGLNSGEVVVGKIGDDLRMDYTAQGHTVGLAQRMEQLAETGKALLTEHTAKLVEGYFQLRDLGESKIRGVEQPVRIFELEGVGAMRTRLDRSRARGFSKFVGRGDEMAVLEAALERAKSGQGQVVGMVGEAGVGKSRLCSEFVELCRAQGLAVNEGHAMAHGKNIPFMPILQVIRAYFGIATADDDRAAREKIAGRLLLLDEAFREVLPLVFELLGVPDPARPAPRMDPEARQRQLFGVLRRVIRGGSEEAVGVTLLEDLHWLDGGSEAWLREWADAIAGTRSLLIVNFRPEYHAAWMQKSYYQQLALAPLGPEAIRELLEDLLGSDPSTEGLADAIHARTLGNPFFTEEFVQSLIESGHLEGGRGSYRLITPIERIEVPESVQALVAARIDRLGALEKQVLQTAAVIGRQFAEPVLDAVAELPQRDLSAALAQLTSGEFLVEQALYPVAEYDFKHPLMQVVALESQLRERRGRIHEAVARAIEQLYPEKLEERSPLIAHHWEQAGRALEAARWHARAAEWVGVSDAAEAHRHWSRVRALLENGEASPETLQLGLVARCALLEFGFFVGTSAEEATRLLDEGQRLAQGAGVPALLARLLGAYAAAKGTAGDLDAYQRYAQEAARVADATNDPQIRADAHAPFAFSLWLAGRLHEALATCNATLDWAPRQAPEDGAWHFDAYAFLLFTRGRILHDMGRLREGAEDLEHALSLALQNEDAENVTWTLMAQAETAARNFGDPVASLQHARRAFETAERSGNSFDRAMAIHELGTAQLASGQWSTAMDSAERALAIMRETGAGLGFEPWVLLDLADALLGAGDHTAARQHVEEGLERARAQSSPKSELELLLLRARVLARTEGERARAQIERDLDQAQALIEQTGYRIREPLLHERRAELARLDGDGARQERELREALRLYTEMGATGHAERVASEPTR
jgi:class 3 adenylate cyclase/tetratricopeptide (TPR) repeat protein